MLIITTILISLCIQVVNILENRKVYGILYSNGMSRKDVLWINMTESIVRGVISLISGGIMCYYAISNNVENRLEQMMNIDILLRFSLAKVIVIVLGVTLLSGIIPYILTKKSSPDRLIRGGI